MKIDQMSEDGIRRLVDEFYARVRVDTELAPIFKRAIPGDWGLVDQTVPVRLAATQPSHHRAA